jgi:hypothetical protein
MSSDPSLNKPMSNDELKLKSISLPVIERPNDSDKYMELPHLHKMDNLEDLTSVTVREEINSDGTVETVTTTITTISSGTDQPISEISTQESAIAFSGIDPIKEEADEPQSEDESFHSQQKGSPKQTTDSVDEKHYGSIMTTSVYVHAPSSAEETHHVEEETIIREIPFSMTQSIYGSFPSDEEDHDSTTMSSTTIASPAASVSSEPASGRSKDKSEDPIGDWGKPLGLPLTDDASDFNGLLLWNPIESWGKPYGLPSPGPPPPSSLETQNRASNGDIELNLTPINNKTTPKKSTNKKSSSGKWILFHRLYHLRPYKI